MHAFSPSDTGKLVLSQVPEDFAGRMVRRVEDGLLLPGQRARANYSVRSHDRETVHFGADDVATAFNIGLNEVRVTRVDAQTLHYEFSYHRWARYTLWLCLAIVTPMAVALLVLSYFGVLDQAHDAVPALAWGMIGFWGVVWPWLLVALHRISVARCLERILREVCRDQAPVIVGVGKRYESTAQFLGMPVVCIAMGPDPATGQRRGVARGCIAIGDVAVGLFALGGVAFGGVAVGGLAIGGVALGGAAIGACALGGGALGLVAVGGGAAGLVAIGGGAFGLVSIGVGTFAP